MKVGVPGLILSIPNIIRLASPGDSSIELCPHPARIHIFYVLLLFSFFHGDPFFITLAFKGGPEMHFKMFMTVRAMSVILSLQAVENFQYY